MDSDRCRWHHHSVRVTGPSRTALSAARHRAVHQIVDRAALFEDPLALAIVGLAGADEAVETADNDPAAARMRWFIAARSRFAEERVAAAVATGTRQVIVLGAGLGTLGYRWRPPGTVRIFEVDHPATQAWKRQRLADIGVAEPKTVSYVPVDLETGDLTAALRDADFRAEEGAAVVWLGFLPYLTIDAVAATLTALAGLGPVDVVFDYGEPLDTRDGPARQEHEARASRVAALGEPWITFLSPAQLRDLLSHTGLALVEDTDAARYIRRALGRPDDGKSSPAHLVHARRPPKGLPGCTESAPVDHVITATSAGSGPDTQPL